MSLTYDAIHWTPHKKSYDRLLFAFVLLYVVVFGATQWLLNPGGTIETYIIRTTGSLAFLLLHIVLLIGPLCRLFPVFLPLLYNRRHLGVATFLIGAVHGVFNLVQFHAFANIDPLSALFSSAQILGYNSEVPFQLFGFLALIILLLMAATSHDLWLNILTPRIWKSLHITVYAAYALLVAHVLFGAAQTDHSGTLFWVTMAAAMCVCGCHLTAGIVQNRRDYAARRAEKALSTAGFFFACKDHEVPDSRAKMMVINHTQIALFKHGTQFHAVHNLCKHQNGPLSEGKIIDGCITCPWHGYQYLPETGAAPPPFKEQLDTYAVKVLEGAVYINPTPVRP